MTKKLLLASTVLASMTAVASAADLPRRAPPPVFTPIPVFTWTGFYAGLESSYAFTDRQRITTNGTTPATIANVAAGRRLSTVTTEQDAVGKLGGTFGYNYQFTPGSGFVIGVANSIDWTDLTKNRFVIGAPLAGGVVGNPAAYRQSLDWLGTLTGRVGYGFDRVLVYGMGGLAYGNVFYDARFFTPGNALQFAGRYDDFETGYAYGGGIEFAVPTDSFLNTFAFGKYLGLKYEAVTVKVEYLHYDLGSRNVVVNAVPGVGTGAYVSRFTTEGNVVRAGFNYKFGGL